MATTIPETSLSASEPLPNPRHEAFAQQVASGNNATAAYRGGGARVKRWQANGRAVAIYEGASPEVAAPAGCRLLRRPPIQARIRSLQKAAAQGVVISLNEMLEYLTRVIRTAP